MEEEEQTTKTTSLFAAFAGEPALPSAADSGSGSAQWLQNNSFNTDLSVINDAVTKYNLTYDEEPEDEEDEIDAKKRRRGKREFRNGRLLLRQMRKYYFDSRGDRDNLAFGSIYRLSRLEGDSDVDALDIKLRSGGRYWSAKYAAIERHKDLKRVRVLAPRNHVKSLVADYIPLIDEDPGEEISILEKATELNPDSEDLLLSLMKAYQSRDSIDVLIKRWEKILTSNPASCKLWKEFLWVLQGEFSRFKVSEIRKMYSNAIQALAGACIKQHRQAHPSGNATSIDPSIVQLELGLVDVFIGLCRLEWQAGYQELATALLQAEIEYSLFSPLVLSEQKKEEEQRQRLISEDASDAVEEGGWTGWFNPSSETKEIEMAGITTEGQVVVEELNDGSDSNDVESKDDIEALLKALGIDADAEADIKIKDTETWTKWSKEEMTRDFDHWMPLRANSDGVSHDDATAEGDDDEQLLSKILYEDVSDYLFSLKSEEARFSLVSQFIDFFEGRITQWTCTNSSSWVAKTLSLESPPYSLLEDLGKVHDILTRKSVNLSSFSLELLLSNSDDLNMRSNMMKFLRNAILLCLKVFPQNYILEEAALVAEELSNTRMNSTRYSVTPCRALAKTLLKNNRQDVLLCGVYAKREAFYGNIDHSRKVFDMALSSIDGLPLDAHPNASLLYFWYAEVELANNSSESSDSSSRAIHILSCLGSGARYTPFKGLVSSVQQLRARQGFKDWIKMLSSTGARGVIDDHSAALICSAALFEELTSGWAYALEILENSFTMVLPGLQLYPSNPHLHYALVEISHLYTSPNKLRWTFDDHCRKTPSAVTWLYALAFEISTGGSQHRIRGLFERALEDDKLHNSVILWRCFIEYERSVACNISGAKRVFFRAIHACPWSKRLWLDGFLKLNSVPECERAVGPPRSHARKGTQSED
ncbi:hypothetical protein C2S51_038938 [Perilla frutescens var. frutescens]|nr:hypothetical protein C2S51_038938 [Perilla frutescens var. frutescens]